MEKNIKILISYHKPTQLIKNDIFIPIHLGRDLAFNISKDGSLNPEDIKWLTDNMIGDNTGDNISKLNREYCELTALYWAWKNYDKIGNPDYFGMMHYRRHFIFNEEYIKKNISKIDTCNMIRTEYMDDGYKESIGLNESICKLIDRNTCIVSSNTLDNSPYEYHKNLTFINQKNYENSINYIINHSSLKMQPYIKKYLNGKNFYWSNMFIVPRQIFFECCEWLFNSLFEVYKIIDFTNASIAERRFMGYLAESLLGAYWEYLKDSGYKIISLPISFVEYPDIINPIVPSSQEDVYICYSSDRKYIKYLSVSIESISKNISNQRLYNIFILENNIDSISKQKLINNFVQYKNIKIKFININYLIYKHANNINSTYEWYTPAIYYRYFIPEIFKNFKKIIYLDCDTIVVDDISKLYDIPLDNHMIASCIDIERRRWLKDKKTHDKTINFDKSLNIMDSMKYFNSGVCLFNIEKMIQYKVMDRCLELTGKIIQKHWIGDQDVLNSICYNDVKYIDISWNVMMVVHNKIKDWSVELDENSCVLYQNSLKSPKIIHFCDNQKPWTDTSILYSDLWWNYARNSSFFIDILDEFFIKKYYSSTKTDDNINSKIDLYFINKFNFIRYRILKEITFGKKKKYYKLKYENLKKQFYN